MIWGDNDIAILLVYLPCINMIIVSVVVNIKCTWLVEVKNSIAVWGNSTRQYLGMVTGIQRQTSIDDQ